MRVTRHVGAATRGCKGALRMDMCVRVRRGLVVAGLLLGAGLFGFAAGAALAAPAAGRRDRKLDRGPRQPPRRSRHDPLVFQGGARRASRCRQDRRRPEGALRLGPVPGRPHFPVGRPHHRHGGGGAGHQSARLRRQPPHEGRAAPGGNPIEGARLAVARRGAGGHPAHHRGLSPQRALRRHRRAEDHRAAEQPRRSDLRNQRRRKDRRQVHRLRRQQCLLGLAPEGGNQDVRIELGSASCRPRTSTIPTASRPTAT